MSPVTSQRSCLLLGEVMWTDSKEVESALWERKSKVAIHEQAAWLNSKPCSTGILPLLPHSPSSSPTPSGLCEREMLGVLL